MRLRSGLVRGRTTGKSDGDQASTRRTLRAGWAAASTASALVRQRAASLRLKSATGQGTTATFHLSEHAADLPRCYLPEGSMSEAGSGAGAGRRPPPTVRPGPDWGARRPLRHRSRRHRATAPQVAAAGGPTSSRWSVDARHGRCRGDSWGLGPAPGRRAHVAAGRDDCLHVEQPDLLGILVVGRVAPPERSATSPAVCCVLGLVARRGRAGSSGGWWAGRHWKHTRLIHL
jgi:hypothetical protein